MSRIKLIIGAKVGNAPPPPPDLGTIVTTDPELTAALTAAYAGGVPATITLNGTFAAGRTIAASTNTALLTIQGHPSYPRTQLSGVTLGSNSKLLYFKHIDFGAESYTGTSFKSSNTEANRARDITIDDCEFHGIALDPMDNSMSGNSRPDGPPGNRPGLIGRYENLTVINSCHRDSYQAHKPIGVLGFHIYENNVHARIYVDDFFHSFATSQPGSRYRGNFSTQPLAKLSDTGAPHVDAAQLTMGGVFGLTVPGVTIEGNVIYDGVSRGSFHHVLMQSSGDDENTTSRYEQPRIADNLSICNDGAAHAPSVGISHGAYGARNRALRATPGSGSGTSVSAISAANFPVYGNCMVDGSGEQISVTGPGSVDVGNDKNIPNTLVEYQARFVGPFGTDLPTGTEAEMRATKLALVARYEYKVGSTQERLIGIYDYETLTVDKSRERSVLTIAAITGAVANTDVETPWTPALGGEDGQTATAAAGCLISRATDASGTGATTYAASVTYNPGQFLRIKRTSSATTGGVVSIGATLNGYSYSANVTTA